MKSLQSYRESDPNDDAKTGLLAGDSLLRSIMSEMRLSNGTAINGYEGGPYYLST